MLSDILNPLVMGVFLGGLYATIALGLSLTFGVAKEINLAHGYLVVLGSYFVFWLTSSFGLDPLLCLLFGIPVAFFVGYLLQRYLLNYSMKVSEDTILVVTFGIAVILQNFMQLKWGLLSRNLTRDYLFTTLDMGALYVPLNYLLDFVVAIVVMVALHAFLTRTFTGRAVRASAQDAVAARLMGIDVQNMYNITFGFSCSLCVIAGTFLGITFPFTPFTGPSLLIIAFWDRSAWGYGQHCRDTYRRDGLWGGPNAERLLPGADGTDASGLCHGLVGSVPYAEGAVWAIGKGWV